MAAEGEHYKRVINGPMIKSRWKYLLTASVAAAVLCLSACGAQGDAGNTVEENVASEGSGEASEGEEITTEGETSAGSLEAPDYTDKVSGVIGVFNDGSVMLFADAYGPILLSGDMNTENLKNGDRVTVYCDGIEETYPAETHVTEMRFSGSGSADDLPEEDLKELEALGYELKETVEEAAYQQITMAEAAECFAKEGDYIILDVRTPEEYAEGHIPGAINISYNTILNTMPEELPDLNQTIYVYCRSGKRSKVGAASLVHLGYTHVVECGGILDWTGEIEK